MNGFSKNNKVLSEFEYRRNIMSHAKKLGIERDILQFFSKYDNLLKTCRNPQERKQIAVLGNVELYKLFGGWEGLTVDGQVIIPPNEEIAKKESQ